MIFLVIIYGLGFLGTMGGIAAVLDKRDEDKGIATADRKTSAAAFGCLVAGLVWPLVLTLLITYALGYKFAKDNPL